MTNYSAGTINLQLDLDEVDHLLDFLASGDYWDDPYLQEIAHSIHEQTYL